MKFEALVLVFTQSDDKSVCIRLPALKVLVLSWSHSTSSCCTISSLHRKEFSGRASMMTNKGYVCTVDFKRRTWHCSAVSSKFSQISLLKLRCYWPDIHLGGQACQEGGLHVLRKTRYQSSASLMAELISVLLYILSKLLKYKAKKEKVLQI